MKLKLLLVPVLLIANLTALIAQENILPQYLPAKTNMVICVNPLRLILKIPGESFRQSAVYRELMKNPSSPINAILNNPASTGIDFSGGILIFSVPNPDGSSKSQFQIMGRLQQPALFEKLVSDVSGEKKISTYGTDKMMLNDENGLAWNDKIFVFTGGGNNDVSYADYPEDTATAAIEAWDLARKEKATKQLRDACFDLLTIKKENGFSGDPLFKEFLSKPADLKVWGNGQGSEIPAKMFPMGDLIRELQSFTAGTKTSYLDFENGKIVARSYNYLSGGLNEIYSKYPPAQQNQALLKKLPQGKLLGLINMSYSNEMGKELMQSKIIRELLDSARKYIAFDFDKLPGVFGDHLMLAVVQTDENNKKDGIQFIFAMPIADQARYDQLSKAVKQLYDSLKNTESGEKTLKKFEPFVKTGNGLFVLSLSEKTADAFLANPGTQPVPANLEEFSKYPLLVHVNMREIISTVFTNPRINSDEKMEGVQKMLGIFDQLIVYGGEYKNGNVNSTFEFRFTDPNKNSFHQLFDLVSTMAEMKSESAVDMNNVDVDVQSDTTAVKEQLPDPPKFKNPEVQELINEYIAYFTEVLEIQKSGDSLRLSNISKSAEDLAAKLLVVTNTLANDTEELKKFMDYLVIVSQNFGPQIAETYSNRSPIVEEVKVVDINQEAVKDPPPPPPPPPLPPAVKKKKKG